MIPAALFGFLDDADGRYRKRGVVSFFLLLVPSWDCI